MGGAPGIGAEGPGGPKHEELMQDYESDEGGGGGGGIGGGGYAPVGDVMCSSSGSDSEGGAPVGRGPGRAMGMDDDELEMMDDDWDDL